jgi:hypothetical protein
MVRQRHKAAVRRIGHPLEITEPGRPIPLSGVIGPLDALRCDQEPLITSEPHVRLAALDRKESHR